LGLIAENGGYIKLIDSKRWVSIVDEKESFKWMPQVQQIVEAKVERLPGSKADVEDCTIIFSPGKSLNEDRSRSISLMGDLIQHVNEIFDESEGVHASLIRNSVVIQQNQLSLRALNFLVNFYNKESVTDFDPKEVHDSAASTPIKEKNSVLESLQANHDDKLTGLFVSGGTTSVDEPIYNFGNQLFNNDVLPQVLTVATIENDCKGTSAKYGVFGRNELLSIISNTVKGLRE
jgi:trehalose 6-phosphate synthase/phosphatase